MPRGKPEARRVVYSGPPALMARKKLFARVKDGLDVLRESAHARYLEYIVRACEDARMLMPNAAESRERLGHYLRAHQGTPTVGQPTLKEYTDAVLTDVRFAVRVFSDDGGLTIDGYIDWVAGMTARVNGIIARMVVEGHARKVSDDDVSHTAQE